MSGMVECKKCKAQFPGSGTQGHGCACSVYEKDGKWFLAGHYGSRLFDMEIWEFVDPEDPEDAKWCARPTEPTDPVCDVCVEEWKRLGRIKLFRENVL